MRDYVRLVLLIISLAFCMAVVVVSLNEPGFADIRGAVTVLALAMLCLTLAVWT